MFNAIHVDRPLSNFAVDFQPADSIADRVLSVIMVDKQSDGYYVFDQGPQWRAEQDLRAPGTEAKRITLTVGTATYYCPNYELMGGVTIEEMGNMDEQVRSKFTDEVGAVRLKIDLGREIRLARMMHATCGSRTAVASDWNDHANSDPFSDIRAQMRNVWLSTGYWPNKAVTNGLVADHLSQNQRLLDAVRNPNVTTRAGFESTMSGIAQVLGLSEILVGKMMVNMTEEGATQALTQVWSNTFIVYYDPPGANTKQPRLGAQFRWNPQGLGGVGMYVQRHAFDTKKKSQEISVGHYTSETAVFSACGAALLAAAT